MYKNIVFIILICFFQKGYSKNIEIDYSKTLDKNGKVYVKKSIEPLTGMVKYKKDREFYKNGVPEGKWLSFFSDGKIKSIENWKNGSLNGKYILYNQKGIKSFQTYYLNGKDHGNFKLYHENGKLQIMGRFIYGKAIGVWNYYDKSGRLIGKKDYTEHVKHFDQNN